MQENVGFDAKVTCVDSTGRLGLAISQTGLGAPCLFLCRRAEGLRAASGSMLSRGQFPSLNKQGEVPALLLLSGRAGVQCPGTVPGRYGNKHTRRGSQGRREQGCTVNGPRACGARELAPRCCHRDPWSLGLPGSLFRRTEGNACHAICPWGPRPSARWPQETQLMILFPQTGSAGAAVEITWKADEDEEPNVGAPQGKRGGGTPSLGSAAARPDGWVAASHRAGPCAWDGQFVWAPRFSRVLLHQGQVCETQSDLRPAQ
ncbi:hypothetical protein KIL84_011791, partial [Mauremys mutica]